ncbi:MAG: hypothetical protein F6K10_01450 [Moorea sp. SIO2B7]|nr:hypothetical protein [Moorena sp. SIO2B7]
MENKVRKNPVRFAQLIQQFYNNTHIYYFNGVLRGIAETELQIDGSIAFDVCQKCHQLPEKPCGREISWLFQKLAYLPWQEEALDMVIYYALKDTNPQQELWRTKARADQVYYDGDILQAGINSVRGSAVSAIAKLIFKDKNRTAYFQEALEKIVSDYSIAVRSCAAEALTAVLNYDRDLAVRLFIKLCDTEDILLKTSTVDHFLYYALPTHFQDLKAIIIRMINSEIPEVQEIGAKQTFVISINIEEAKPLAEQCLSGTDNHCKAAAKVYAANLAKADYRAFCEQSIIKLLGYKDCCLQADISKC